MTTKVKVGRNKLPSAERRTKTRKRIDSIIMDKPRPGGSRDDTRITLDLTPSELMDLLKYLALKHPSKRQPAKLPSYEDGGNGLNG